MKTKAIMIITLLLLVGSSISHAAVYSLDLSGGTTAHYTSLSYTAGMDGIRAINYSSHNYGIGVAFTNSDNTVNWNCSFWGGSVPMNEGTWYTMATKFDANNLGPSPMMIIYGNPQGSVGYMPDSILGGFYVLGAEYAKADGSPTTADDKDGILTTAAIDFKFWDKADPENETRGLLRVNSWEPRDYFNNIPVIPEPSTIMTFIFGAGLFLLRRKR
jgi:hypothetical protein